MSATAARMTGLRTAHAADSLAACGTAAADACFACGTARTSTPPRRDIVLSPRGGEYHQVPARRPQGASRCTMGHVTSDYQVRVTLAELVATLSLVADLGMG